MKKDLTLTSGSISTCADHGDTITKAEGVKMDLLMEQITHHEVAYYMEAKSVIAELISIHGIESVKQMVLDCAESEE